jgi:hypothetical protein
MATPTMLDTAELARQVKALYRQVAQQPTAAVHFPLGGSLAERLGYPAELLDAGPAEALASFAGVGYALDLAGLTPGVRVLDLGSGSVTDSSAAALVGPTGQVTGIDMTDEQRAKADRLRGDAAAPVRARPAGRPTVRRRRVRRGHLQRRGQPLPTCSTATRRPAAATWSARSVSTRVSSTPTGC